MYDYLFDIRPDTVLIILLRLFILPIAALILVGLLQLILLRTEKKESPFPVRLKFTLMRSIIIAYILMNVYWFYFIKFNGTEVFHWHNFSFSLHNTYLSVLPILLTLLMLIVLFFRARTSINKLI
jgi:hypothetical protein